MAKIIGYMITWTTYGTWLRGEKRRYLKDGKVLEEKRGLRGVNTWRLKHKAVRLDNKSRTIVRQAILKEADRLGQVIYIHWRFVPAMYIWWLVLLMRQQGKQPAVIRERQQKP